MNIIMSDELQKDYHDELNTLMVRRREELEHLRAAGVEPYPHGFERNTSAKEILDTYKDDQPQWIVAVAGRIMSIRRMGKASFCHIQDMTGRIQSYMKKDDLGDAYDHFKLMDIGDIIGIEGFVFRTKMGEVSIHAQKFVLLSKSLRPLPVVKEKTDEQGNKVTFDPFSDKELRYRQRYVDLVVNPSVRETFIKRSMILRQMRNFLD
jgi:lysyl-tRNA synthetase class 2